MSLQDLIENTAQKLEMQITNLEIASHPTELSVLSAEVRQLTFFLKELKALNENN